MVNLGDVYREGEEGEEEPEWVKNEREQFSMFRDKNKDGYMDNEEVRSLILNINYH